MNEKARIILRLTLQSLSLGLLLLCLAFCWPSREMFGAPYSENHVLYGPFTLFGFLSNAHYSLGSRVFIGLLYFSLPADIVLAMVIIVLTALRKKTFGFGFAFIVICLVFGWFAGMFFDRGRAFDPAYSYPHYLVPSYLSAISMGIAMFLGRRIALTEGEAEATEKRKPAHRRILTAFLVVSCVCFVAALGSLWPSRPIFGSKHTGYLDGHAVTIYPTDLWSFFKSDQYSSASKWLVLVTFGLYFAALIFAILALINVRKNKQAPFLSGFGAGFALLGSVQGYATIGFQSSGNVGISLLYGLPMFIGGVVLIVSTVIMALDRRKERLSLRNKG